MCGITDEAESAEMARLTIDVHVQMTHPSSETVRVRPDPAGEPMALGRDDPDRDAGEPPDDQSTRDRDA
jgi:hypothetical protein